MTPLIFQIFIWFSAGATAVGSFYVWRKSNGTVAQSVFVGLVMMLLFFFAMELVGIRL